MLLRGCGSGLAVRRQRHRAVTGCRHPGYGHGPTWDVIAKQAAIAAIRTGLNHLLEKELK